MEWYVIRQSGLTNEMVTKTVHQTLCKSLWQFKTRPLLAICSKNPLKFTAVFAGSLEAAYSLNWGAPEISGKGGGETLAL